MVGCSANVRSSASANIPKHGSDYACPSTPWRRWNLVKLAAASDLIEFAEGNQHSKRANMSAGGHAEYRLGTLK